MFLVSIQEIHPTGKVLKQSIISHFIIKENTNKLIKGLALEKIIEDFNLNEIEKLCWKLRASDQYLLEVTRKNNLICSRLRRVHIKKFYIKVSPFYSIENIEKFSFLLTHQNEEIRKFVRDIFDEP